MCLGQILERTADGYVWTAKPSGGGGGEENVQSDWTQSDDTSDSYIRNKPTIPDVSGFAPLDPPVFTTSANAPTPAAASADTSIATTAWTRTFTPSEIQDKVVVETANPVARAVGGHGVRLTLTTDGVPSATPTLTDTLLLWDAVNERWVQTTANALMALFHPVLDLGVRYLFVQPYPGGATSYAPPTSITAADITADGASNSSTTHELVFPSWSTGEERNMLIAIPNSEPDLTVVKSPPGDSNPFNLFNSDAFVKWPTRVDVGGTEYKVWYQVGGAFASNGGSIWEVR